MNITSHLIRLYKSIDGGVTLNIILGGFRLSVVPIQDSPQDAYQKATIRDRLLDSHLVF